MRNIVVHLKHLPTDTDDLTYPTWTALLDHLGQTLTPYIENHEWCKSVGIKNGGDYLKLWITSVIKDPYSPLPYLFFYSKENNTGKSTFHEAFDLLLTKGLVSGSNALLTNFNGELASAIVVYVEEVDLRQNKAAANKIKDWVTAKNLTIHSKGETTYSVPNTTHWIQCSNHSNYCPVFPGDNRITVVHVPPIKDVIPKSVLFARLAKEAPDFCTDILSTDLPVPNERLNLPAIATDAKKLV